MNKTVQRFGIPKPKNRLIFQNQWRLIALGFLLVTSISLFGEGSIDFINYPGNRLFYSANEQQQLKVYANEGEFINVGASHVGITGGYINVYRPDGTLHTRFDNTGATTGLAIIYNDIEEKNGPTGGGLTMGGGYLPGIISVGNGEEGIWTVTMEFPDPTILVFNNLLNSDPWTRQMNQPTIRRGVLAWDITVSQNAAGNQNGTFVTGRVFSNEYISVVSRNGNMTSPEYNILTKDGFMYKVKFMETDPWNFPLFSTSLGIVQGDGSPAYRSLAVEDIIRTADIANWDPNLFYLYEPQAEDKDSYINNKIFFNLPNSDLPASAMTTDIFRNNTHTTWLYNTPPDIEFTINNFTFTGQNSLTESPCPPDMMEQDGVAFIAFNSNLGGTGVLRLDLNGDGDYDDDVDRDIYKYIQAGGDTIVWDGLNGLGEVLSFSDGYTINYRLEVRGGEIHVLMSDIENNFGGVTFELLNPPTSTGHDNSFYYDHSPIGDAGDVSGGGVPGKPLPTTIPFTYANNFGNEKMLDYWTFIDYGGQGVGTFDIDVVANCDEEEIIKDNDGDGITDQDDLDDDNDGVPDKLEFCVLLNSFDCLPNDLDPSGDEDGDGIANFEDADDEAVGLNCTDNNEDGICDHIPFQYDLDGDNVPNHFDLDNDNDGITDLVEAGHGQADLDGNGIIDGEPADFGLNGLYNALATDPDAFTALANYVPWDKDGDTIPDHHDLDSDNDGINDVTEAGFGEFDINNTGRLAALNNTNPNGLGAVIDPVNTGVPIPLPLDTDGDLVPDWHDLDTDNDGINDVEEGGHADGDGDGMIGTGSIQVSPNGQAVIDATLTQLSTSSYPTSTDGDLIPDYRDLDSDNDGLNDVAEAGHGDDDNDGIIGSGQPEVNADGQATADDILPISNPKDKDQDGLPDYQDLDSDNDGINDVEETGHGAGDADNDGIIGIGQPTVNENGQAIADMSGSLLTVTSQIRDTDSDGVPDYNDLDTDNDGIYDVEEAGFTGADPDEDGVMGTGTPNINVHGQPSADINNVTITSTSKPKQTDFDQIADYQDLDTDNDGINDVEEANGADLDNDGIVGTGMPLVNDNGVVTADAGGSDIHTTSFPKDKDTDGLADYRDLDSDNDAINDVEEVGNADEDGDGVAGTGNPIVNVFGQPVTDPINTPIATTSLVPDTDGDGVPDYNDLDSDNDAINDVLEGGSFDEDNDGIAGTGMPFVNDNGQPLISGNGQIIFNTSNPTDTDEDDTPDYQDLDSDSDGISDVVEGGHLDPDNNDMVGIGIPPVNENGQAMGEDAPTSNPTETDGDGDYDFQELDSDNDGILDIYECPSDSPCVDGDGDGMFDFQDIDRDNDGIEDFYECETGAPCVDTDNDGIPDVDDLDSDNDTISDADECPNGTPCPDSNMNDIDNFREIDCIASSLPQITNLLGNGSYCAGDDLVLSATNANPLEGEITFTWTGPNDFQFTGTAAAEGPFMVMIPNADINNEGGYTLTLESEAGCPSSSQSVVVNINSQPITPMLSADATQICAGESILLNTTAYTGDVTYNWYYSEVNSNNSTLIEMTESPTLIIAETNALNSGTYSVVVTVDGCNSNLSNEEQVMVLGIGEPITTDNSSSPESPACVGETVSFTASPLIEGTTYEWVGPNGFTSTLPRPVIENIGLADAGEYMVFVSQNGCPPVASFSTTIYVQATVQPVIGGGGILCAGESVSMEVTNDLQIEAGSTVTYQWFEAATNTIVATTTEPSLTLQNVTSEDAGEYYLGVNVNGCPAQNSNMVTVQLIAEPNEQAIVVKEVLRVCDDQEMPIEAIVPTEAIGTWSTLSNATIISPNEATTMIFGLEEGDNIFVWTLSTAECGAYSSDTLNVVLGEVTVDAKADVLEIDYETTLSDYDLLANDDLADLIAEGYTFSIVQGPARGDLTFDENGVITYVPQESFFGLVEFTYEVCSVVCPDVCDETTVKITVGQTQFAGECFVPNTFTPNEDGMNDAFRIDCLDNLHPNNKIMIFNRWGDKVFEKEGYRNDWKGTYDDQPLPPGTYFYILKLDKNLEASLQGYMSLIR